VGFPTLLPDFNLQVSEQNLLQKKTENLILAVAGPGEIQILKFNLNRHGGYYGHSGRPIFN
jgi:hypothetical protein